MEAHEKQFRKRSAILSCLQQSHCHPSAEELHRQLQQKDSSISLATVYRNLARFKEQGLILSLGTVGGIERFDGNTAPHVHFACSQCGRVLDLPNPELPGQAEAMAARDLGCRVDTVQVMLTGICNTCVEKQ